MRTTDDSLLGFRVSVGFVGKGAVIGLEGELDLLTARELAAIFDALIDRGHRYLVLDLAELDYMGASGLRVIAAAANRLGQGGGELTIRAPSDLVREIFGIPEWTKLVRLEQPPAPGATAANGLAQDVRQAVAIQAHHDMIDGVLRLVVHLARATVGGADGVSVSLRRRGHLVTVASSDQTILDMDAIQYATDEGPCVDASVKGHGLHVDSLASETRWPAFTPKAQALGINAILSSPLLASDQPVGALNIYSRTTSVFTDEDQKLASLFARQASVVLTDAGVEVTNEKIADRLHEAMRAWEVIAQAQGVMMERDGLDEDAAYANLRNDLLGTDRRIRERAQEIVDSTRAQGKAMRPPGQPGHLPSERGWTPVNAGPSAHL